MRVTVFKHMVPNVITGGCLPTEISRKAHLNLDLDCVLNTQCHE